MSNSVSGLFAVMVAGVLTGCAGTRPPPEPLDAESAALGVSMSIRGMFGITESPQVVYFARLEEGEDIDAACRKDVLVASNLVGEDQIFLLNAKPGTYVAVAAAYSKTTPHPGPVHAASTHVGSNVTVSVSYDPFGDTEEVYRTYFDRDLIERTKVTVGAGSVAYVGRITVKKSSQINKGDEAQKHYAQVLEGGRKSFMSRLLSGEFAFRGSVHEFQRDGKTERGFLASANKVFEKTAWSGHVSRRLKQIEGQQITDR